LLGICCPSHTGRRIRGAPYKSTFERIEFAFEKIV
jgi:hypothetical protein